MAQAEATKQEDMSEEKNDNGSNGGGAARTAVRAAAIAAVSGATALAAKKAFVDRGGSSEDKPERREQKKGQKGGNSEVFGSMVSSAWDSARDALVPMLEDAAGSAGEYLAQNGPEVIRETIVPSFIDGFERGRGSDSDE